jgi:peroxiredoxin
MTLIVLGVVLPWLAIGLGGWFGFQLLRQNGRLLFRLQALEQRLAQLPTAPGPSLQPAPGGARSLSVGSVAPAFELPDLNGGRVSLEQFRGRSVLLIFFNPGCGFCTRMAPDIAALSADERHGRPVPLVVTTGDADANRKLVEEHDIRCPVLLQEQHGLLTSYQANGTPSGYLIDADGKIASELAVGAQALLALVNGPGTGANGRCGQSTAAANQNGQAVLGGKRSVEDSKLDRSGLKAGTRAPNFVLPRLDGGELSLEEYRGGPVLLVFSDPHCHPCDQLVPQLERWHRGSGDVQVLMVSRGDDQMNRLKVAEHGLTFPVVLQQQWEISREYARFGTPIAYLINEEGLIAADVAVGVEPILALLSGAVVPTNGNGKGKATPPRRGKEGTTRLR